MSGIGPGDVVVCVKAGVPNVPGLADTGVRALRVGRIYRVASAFVCPVSGVALVRLVGYPHAHAGSGCATECFRKLDNDTGFDFREQLRAKPKQLETTNTPRATSPSAGSGGGRFPPISAPASSHHKSPEGRA